MHDMQDTPLISVIIPTKDRCSLVKETLESVRNQTYSNWEAVVVDDHSVDDTWSTLADIAEHDPRVRPILRSGALGGAGVARNQGFAASRGELILFLDSDDLIAPTALQSRVSALSNCADADAVVGDAEYFRCTPGENHGECVQSGRLGVGMDPLDAFLTSCSPWCTSGPLWRRAAVERVGPWKTSHDNQYHVYALVTGIRFVRIGVIDWFIRLHGGVHVSQPSIQALAAKREVLTDTMELLRIHQLLTRRRKRMLAWGCLVETLTCSVLLPRRSLRYTLDLLKEARRRKLLGTAAYMSALMFIGLQRSRVIGLAPRELVRLLIYFDLKREPVFTKAWVLAVGEYLRYLVLHFRNWNRGSRDKATGETS